MILTVLMKVNYSGALNSSFQEHEIFPNSLKQLHFSFCNYLQFGFSISW